MSGGRDPIPRGGPETVEAPSAVSGFARATRRWPAGAFVMAAALIAVSAFGTRADAQAAVLSCPAGMVFDSSSGLCLTPRTETASRPSSCAGGSVLASGGTVCQVQVTTTVDTGRTQQVYSHTTYSDVWVPTGTETVQTGTTRVWVPAQTMIEPLVPPLQVQTGTTRRCDFDPVSGLSFNCRDVPVYSYQTTHTVTIPGYWREEPVYEQRETGYWDKVATDHYTTVPVYETVVTWSTMPAIQGPCPSGWQTAGSHCSRTVLGPPSAVPSAGPDTGTSQPDSDGPTASPTTTTAAPTTTTAAPTTTTTAAPATTTAAPATTTTAAPTTTTAAPAPQCATLPPLPLASADAAALAWQSHVRSANAASSGQADMPGGGRYVQVAPGRGWMRAHRTVQVSDANCVWTATKLRTAWSELRPWVTAERRRIVAVPEAKHVVDRWDALSADQQQLLRQWHRSGAAPAEVTCALADAAGTAAASRCGWLLVHPATYAWRFEVCFEAAPAPGAGQSPAGAGCWTTLASGVDWIQTVSDYADDRVTVTQSGARP